jgi:hypothetical protein
MITSQTSKPVTLSELPFILFFVGVIEEVQENHEQFQGTLPPLCPRKVTFT